LSQKVNRVAKNHSSKRITNIQQNMNKSKKS
jgi:hypothetical protein